MAEEAPLFANPDPEPEPQSKPGPVEVPEHMRNAQDISEAVAEANQIRKGSPDDPQLAEEVKAAVNRTLGIRRDRQKRPDIVITNEDLEDV